MWAHFQVSGLLLTLAGISGRVPNGEKMIKNAGTGSSSWMNTFHSQLRWACLASINDPSSGMRYFRRFYHSILLRLMLNKRCTIQLQLWWPSTWASGGHRPADGQLTKIRGGGERRHSSCMWIHRLHKPKSPTETDSDSNTEFLKKVEIFLFGPFYVV